jgi:ribosomal protein S27AE
MSEAPELCPKCGEHCYAKLLNKTGTKVYDEEQFCPRCNAHLAASGICLNACHLSAESLGRFQALFK